TLGDFGHPLTVAVKEANAYCIRKGKVFVPENTSYVPMAFGRPEHAQLIFRCVDKNDVENQRPNWRKEPDTVIENR
ncbi:MAG: hypothetical protein M0Z75_08625, partial [Nitrospiraceae bacterium]|nr:hypothetical protein [Nitrospiraceae bacterium]